MKELVLLLSLLLLLCCAGYFQAIYDHAAKSRKGALPGSVDAYRSLCYERNDSERTYTSWSCGNNKAVIET